MASVDMEKFHDLALSLAIGPFVHGGPYRVGRWLMATDGHVMMSVLCDAPEGYPFPRQIKGALRIIEAQLGDEWASVAELKDFIGDITRCRRCNADRKIVCSWCDGSGKENVKCDECDHEHWHACPNSCEDGMIDCRCWIEARAVFAFGARTFHAAPILPLLTPVLAELYRFSVSDPFLCLGGDDWRIAVAPLNRAVDSGMRTFTPTALRSEVPA